MNKIPLIALLTDFGLTDAYVGIMKGVLSSICPAARLVDITHAIMPQNVRQAAYALLQAYRYFPPDTVFLVVVDPGVGTARAPVAVQTDHGVYVAPDNGVLTYVLAQTTVQRSVTLADPTYHLANVSQTFHGRDIFSPAAAHIANGVPLAALGPAQPDLVRLDTPRLVVGAGEIHGEVLHVDHFGNIITSIGLLTWTAPDRVQFAPRFGVQQDTRLELNPAVCCVTLAGRTLQPVRATYGAVAVGSLVPLVGSTGQLEVGINQGHAAQALGVTLGDPVTLAWNA